MKLEIESDAFDDLFKAILIDDWKKVKGEGMRLRSSENLYPNQKDEIKYNKKLRKAYERIIRYVCTYYEAEEILGKKEKPFV
jgi:hypothetical protein